MVNKMVMLALGVGVLLSMSAAWAATSGSAGGAAEEPASVLGFTVEDIHGKPVKLETFKGDVLLIVNVASKCGNTPQYEQLEAAYQKYHGQGFAVLGFPANNFGHQEPGTNAQIEEFCRATYDVKFPMFSKISVKGADEAPLYRFLTSQDTKPQPKGDITWNFEKFLVGRDGQIIARFSPKTKPDAPEVIAAIDRALAQPKAGK